MISNIFACLFLLAIGALIWINLNTIKHTKKINQAFVDLLLEIKGILTDIATQNVSLITVNEKILSNQKDEELLSKLCDYRKTLRHQADTNQKSMAGIQEVNNTLIELSKVIASCAKHWVKLIGEDFDEEKIP